MKMMGDGEGGELCLREGGHPAADVGEHPGILVDHGHGLAHHLPAFKTPLFSTEELEDDRRRRRRHSRRSWSSCPGSWGSNWTISWSERNGFAKRTCLTRVIGRGRLRMKVMKD